MGSPGVERRATASFHSEELHVLQAPNLDFSNSAMFYCLGLNWEYIFFSCIFQAGITGSDTIRGPSFIGSKKPLFYCHHLLLILPILCLRNAFSIICGCVGMCVCSVSWSLKHLNNFSHEPDCNLTDLRFGAILPLGLIYVS